MTITTKHKFVSTVPDSKDTSQVRASNWNDDHTITVSTGKVLLGNASAAASDVAEITLGDGLSISDAGSLEYAGTISRVTGLQAALDGKSTPADVAASIAALSIVYEPKDAGIQAHIASTTNPHGVTKAQVGLGNVDNTADADKPVSTATQTALDDRYSKLTTVDATTLTGSETMPVLQAGIEKRVSVNQIVADKALLASKVDGTGAFAGLVGPAGTTAQEYIVVASGAPSDADGRPNGTLYFRMA